MTEIMTLAEMEKHFPSEWVLIDQIEADQDDHIRRGKVVYHSKDRDEVWRQACTLPISRHIAVHFMGDRFLPDMEYLLSMIGPLSFNE